MAIHILRREFISLLSGAASWPLAARAQQPAMRKVGVLMSASSADPYQQANVAAFVEAFEKLGWTADRNVLIDYRWGASEAQRTRTSAKELVDLAPNVILVQGSALPALSDETRTIPIVFVLGAGGDPAEQGLVTSVRRPGGNITGFNHQELSISGKWVQLLHDTAPRVTRVGVVFNPEITPYARSYMRAVEAAASSIGVTAVATTVHDNAEIDGQISSIAREPNGGLIIMSDAFTVDHRQRIIDLIAQYRLPAVYPFPIFSRSGGLISWGADVSELFRQAAGYVDRILKGAQPFDLPIQLPTKFQLVVNMKTAKALGLTIPQTLVATADEIIE